MTNAMARVPLQISLTSRKTGAALDPRTEVDAVVTGPGAETLRIPAFWAGGRSFAFRFAPPATGRYTYRTECSDISDTGLHGQAGTIVATAYRGRNPLYRRGRLQVGASKRHLEHADGTPFFWLGDTWWMGLCKRFSWPRDFKALARDRADKGFSVVQIIAGLYPDMPAFDRRGANEAGFPWTKDYGRINPAYFDKADRRIACLVDHGLLPCIVACWGYFIPWMGVEKMKVHWRNLVARYGAYPVTWCLAGEATMPYYLSTEKEKEAAQQKQAWTEIARYVRSIDAYHNPITIHPTDHGRNQVEDAAVLDYDMMQTGHGDRQTIPHNAAAVTAAYTREPRMPVFVAETCYEGIGESCRQEVQRMAFWPAILNGACGHTYGANGIWQVNTRRKPYGPSPHGMSWGNTPWDVAAQLPGSRQLGLSKRLLERYPWWAFEPHPEWIEPRASKDNAFAGYAAGIPRKVRIIYFPNYPWSKVVVSELEPGVTYRAFLFDPATGDRYPLTYKPAADGNWTVQEQPGVPLHLTFPLFQDWVLVLDTVTRHSK